MWLGTSRTKKKMKKYSVDSFGLKSRLTENQINDRLNERTLIKKYLTMESTDKDFIGRVGESKFEIFDSSFFPYGAACILQGTVTSTSDIKLTTTLHNGFRILFTVWAIGMTALFLITWLTDSPTLDSLIPFLIGMPIMILMFRLFIHGMYVLARNKGLKKIKDVLEIVN